MPENNTECRRMWNERYLLNELYIQTWLLKIYCTTGCTRNDTNFADPPAQFSHLTHP